MSALLTISRLSVLLGGRTVVREVSLALHPGRTLAVVGESGSGKSVSALAVMGLLPASRQYRGSICYVGNAGPLELTSLSEQSHRALRGGHIAMIFQEPMTSLNPVLTIGEQVEEALELHGARAAGGVHGKVLSRKGRRARAAAALAEVGIEEGERRLSQYPHEFSGGMRQRVMIAMAIACNPRVLIADEPTTALDVTVRESILDLVQSLRDSRQLAVMLITHDLNIVRARADAVTVMHGGRVLEHGRTDELFARPLHPYTRALMRCEPSLATRGRPLVTVGEVLASEGTGTILSDGRTVRPYWPVEGENADTAAPRLCEVEPGRWLCVDTPVNVESGGDMLASLPDVWAK